MREKNNRKNQRSTNQRKNQNLKMNQQKPKKRTLAPCPVFRTLINVTKKWQRDKRSIM